MAFADLFGHSPASKEFKDIGNQRPSTAERKAELLLKLGAELKRVPKKLGSASIQATRQWAQVRESCAKTAKKRNASVREIEDALASLTEANAD